MSDFIEEMMRNSPKWIYNDADEKAVEELAANTGYSKQVCKILVLRGINNEEDLKHYLYDDIYSLINPYHFVHMLKAVNRVKKAISDGEKIFIFGDRDVDGVLSTAMIYNMLKRFDADVFYKVPEGEYGYGMEKRDIDIAGEKGTTLIVTVDTGISSLDEIQYATSHGIDTIIIDHHVQPTVTPHAFAILNPKMENECYPFEYLSAGGVVLKFIHAFILSHTKNFNRVFIPLLADGEMIRGAIIKNGIIEGYLNFKESIHYPIESNFTIVTDNSRKLPHYFNSWLKEHKIRQLKILCSQPYDSVDEFAQIFISLYLKEQKKSTEFMRSFTDLSAISTISDIMPLIGENRVIVKEGLKQIGCTKNLGLNILLRYCNVSDQTLTARDIAWSLAPLINSAGRMGDAYLAVQLFTTEEAEKANELSKLLIELNEKRKEKGEKNLSIISTIVEDKYYKDPIIILDTDKAEHGVTGIIASKISRKFSKPTIIIVNDGKVGIGSGRSGKDFDLVSLVSKCGDLFVKYGGHKSAIGFTIEIGKIDIFRDRIRSIVENEFDLFKCQETLDIDDKITPEEINFQLLGQLKILEPTGVGNPAPNFYIPDIQIIHPTAIGKDKNHIKFLIPSSNGTMRVIGWGLADKGFSALRESSKLNLVFSIEENHFRGESSLQLVLHDMKASVEEN